MLETVEFLAAAGSSATGNSWLGRNSTLIVGVVGIVVSGLLGPSVSAHFTGARERAKDARALVVARQEDLRQVLDDAAQVLSGAVGRLRPLLAAALKGEELPREPADFLGSLAPLGHRLRLRLPEDDAIVKSYGDTVTSLRSAAKAITSQEEFDHAVETFEAARETFLANASAALRADLFGGTSMKDRANDQ